MKSEDVSCYVSREKLIWHRRCFEWTPPLFRSRSTLVARHGSGVLIASPAWRVVSLPLDACRAKHTVGIAKDKKKDLRPIVKCAPARGPSLHMRFRYVEICFYAWKKNKCRHYSISNKKSYSIIQIAKLFRSKIKFLPSRPGERYASALTNMNLSNKVYKKFGKIDIKDYINNLIK